jgi:periplasmic protein TonB
MGSAWNKAAHARRALKSRDDRREALECAAPLFQGAETIAWTDPEAISLRGFDMAAIRPGALFKPEKTRQPRAKFIWTIACALSLALHFAALIIAAGWSDADRDVATPEAISVEIVADAPSDVTTPSSPDLSAPPETSPPTPETPPLPQPSAPQESQPTTEAEPSTKAPSQAEASPAEQETPPLPPVSPPAVQEPSPPEAQSEARTQEPTPPQPQVPPAEQEPPPLPPVAPPVAQEPSPPPQSQTSPADQETPPLPPVQPPAAQETSPQSIPPPPQAPTPLAEQETPPLPPVPPPQEAKPETATQEAPRLPTPQAPPITPKVKPPEAQSAPKAKPVPPRVVAPPPVAKPLRGRPEPERRAPGRMAQPTEEQSSGGRASISSADAAEYQNSVLSRIAAAKRYPEAARERELHGVVVVRFTISSSGQVGGAAVTQSGGDPILDSEAVATVRRASPFPPPPAGAPRTFSASLNYRMR